MEPEAKYTLVGTVVLVLLALIVVAAVWLKGSGGEREDVPFKIYFANQSLEGLQIRSDVKMQGIKVGSVSSFRISLRRPGTVEVVIRVKEDAPVRQSTSASVDRHLLTGIATIRLVNSDETSPPLTALQTDEVFPLIPEGDSEFSKLSDSMTQVVQRADETMRRINLLLTDENRVAFGEIVANLRRITGNMDRTMAGLDRTLASLGGAADEVRGLSAAITKDAGKLIARYDALGAESTTAAREVAVAMRQISADAARLSGRMDALLADGNVELRVTAQELRATANALGAAARRLNDPGRVLFGPAAGSMGPGEVAK